MSRPARQHLARHVAGQCGRHRVARADAKANTWSKVFMQPLIWLAAKYGIVEANKEVTKKLSLFVRSRWFKPPLDGGSWTP